MTHERALNPRALSAREDLRDVLIRHSPRVVMMRLIILTTVVPGT
ncbi:MAG: hypothetical protein NTY02_20205 [Acidobacteria bacterium]|nr:hypothetical protein [Acidobacteriota bacterium]